MNGPVDLVDNDQSSSSSKKMGKKKAANIAKKEDAKRYREYLESVKQDQLLRLEIRQEAKERQNSKLEKVRRRQEELDILEFNKKRQERLL